MYKIKHYIGSDNRDYFTEWYKKIRDVKARIAIDRRLMRLELGNFGDHKPLREGVWELRVDTGPGYRIYYAKADVCIILLLCGGDKSKQSIDIDRACFYWRAWQAHKGDE